MLKQRLYIFVQAVKKSMRTKMKRKKNQMNLLEIKNTISEKKNLVELTKDQAMKEKRSVNLKTQEQKLYKMKFIKKNH